MTPDGRGFLGAAGGRIQSFRLPLDAGCSVYSHAGQFQQVAVAPGLLAFAESCGKGDSQEAVVVDGSGRLILHVDTEGSFGYSLTDGAFAFAGADTPTLPEVGMYRVDLRTGVLALLGKQKPSIDQFPEVAGRYVLWHDSDSFHVGEFAD